MLYRALPKLRHKNPNCTFVVPVTGETILTRRGAKGATMAPTLATVELVPTPILRTTVGYSSAVYTTMTPNEEVIPSFPIRNNTTTAQFTSEGEQRGSSLELIALLLERPETGLKPWLVAVY